MLVNRVGHFTLTDPTEFRTENRTIKHEIKRVCSGLTDDQNPEKSWILSSGIGVYLVSERSL
ncbi:hypothetical protein Hanom_Chr03g00228311 [Helianthus anomalus]